MIVTMTHSRCSNTFLILKVRSVAPESYLWNQAIKVEARADAAPCWQTLSSARFQETHHKTISLDCHVS